MRTSTLGIVLVAATHLLACGGGGGGGGDSPTLPCHLTAVASYQPPGMGANDWVSGLGVGSTYAVLTTEFFPSAGMPYNQLTALDISNPASPTVKGTRDVSMGVWGLLAVAADKAYLPRVDHSGMTAEVVLDRIDLTKSSLDSTSLQLYAGDPVDLTFTLAGDTTGWLLTGSDLRSVDLSTATPTLGTAVTGGGDVMSIDGAKAYVGGSDQALTVYDLDQKPPKSLGSYPNPFGSAPFGIHAHGGVVALTAGGDGIFVLDATTPGDITSLGSFDTKDWAEGIAGTGNLVFLADGDAGLVVIDATDPAAPVPLQACSTGGYAKQVVVQGHHAFVLTNEKGLTIFDISSLLE